MKPRQHRTTHWLRPNHGSSTPGTVVIVSTAPRVVQLNKRAAGELHQLGAVVALRCRMESGKPTRLEWLDAAKPGAFWAWLDGVLDPRRPVWLMGWQLGYHLTLLRYWDLLEAGDYSLGELGPAQARGDDEGEGGRRPGFLCLSDPPFITVSFRHKSTLVCCDLRNYWHCSLAELAASVGGERLPRPAGDAPLGEWQAWAARDVQLQHDAVTGLMGWWHASDLGSFKMTAAGLSWHAFRHRFLRSRSILIDENPLALKLSRDALAGGEVRCWWVGRVTPEPRQRPGELWPGSKLAIRERAGPVYVIDCQGFYPSLMREHLFPVNLVAHKRGAELADVQAWRQYLALVARVEVESPDEAYPVMHDGQRRYAVGRFWTALAGPELLHAVDSGHVRAVAEVAAYGRGRPFVGFVDHFWAERKRYEAAGDRQRAALVKLISNSLHGKFSQRMPLWQDAPDVEPQRPWGHWPQLDVETGELRTFRAVAGYVQGQQVPELDERPGESPGEQAARFLRILQAETGESHPAIAAFLTAYGRRRMAELRAVAGDGEVIYQDTDSLHLTQLGYERLTAAGHVQAGELGKWKLVGTYESAEYRGLKDYTVGNQLVVAGLKDDVEEVAPGVYRQTMVPWLSELLERGPDGIVRVRRDELRPGRMHAGGDVMTDGTVLPVKLEGGRVRRRRRTERRG